MLKLGMPRTVTFEELFRKDVLCGIALNIMGMIFFF